MSARPAYCGPLALRAVVRADWYPATYLRSGGAWILVLACGHAGGGAGPGSRPVLRLHCVTCAARAVLATTGAR